MDLILLAAKIIIDQQIGLLEDEWKAMHRNAHMGPVLSAFTDDFWAEDIQSYWLYDQSCDLCEQLHEDVLADFGFDWKFYHYGRSGASIYPSAKKAPLDYCYSGAPCKIDLERFYDIDYIEEISFRNMGGSPLDEDEIAFLKGEIENGNQLIKAFKYINETVRESVLYLPTLYKDFVESQKEAAA